MKSTGNSYVLSLYEYFSYSRALNPWREDWISQSFCRLYYFTHIHSFICTVPIAGQLPRGLYTRLMLSINRVCVNCWESNVRNDDVRRKTDQPHLSATVQAWRLSLFCHIVWMPDESDAKQILASPLENLRRPPERPRTMWMKTTRQGLESLNRSLKLYPLVYSGIFTLEYCIV